MKYTLSTITLPFLLLVLNLIWTQNHAEHVPISIAKNVAINIFTDRSEISCPDLYVKSMYVEKSKDKSLFYIVHFSQPGFAIIAADDAVYPVLAYSTTNNFDYENISGGPLWMINKYSVRMAFIGR